MRDRLRGSKTALDDGITYRGFDNRNPIFIPFAELLSKFGIGINDAANGVFLTTVKGASGAYHPGLHTAKYYYTVNSMLSKAKNKDEAIKILNNIGNMLSKGTFPK